MSASWMNYVYLSKLSKPAHDRGIYSTIKRTQPRNIMEIGVGSAERASNMISVAKRFATGAIHYTGIDLFEAAGENRTTLKEAHQRLTPLPAEIRLVPGEPVSALGRCANSLSNVDLVVITTDANLTDITECQPFLARMVHEHSTILIAKAQGLQTLRFADIASPPRQAAA